MKQWALLAAIAMTLSACGGSDKPKGLSSNCQKAYDEYLAQMNVMDKEMVKQAESLGQMTFEEAKKMTHDMYSSMSDNECKESLNSEA